MYTNTPRNIDGTFKSYNDINQTYYIDGKSQGYDQGKQDGAIATAFATLLLLGLSSLARAVKDDLLNNDQHNIRPVNYGSRDYGTRRLY